MTSRFHNKQLVLLGGILLVFVLAFTLLYFFLLDPVKKELAAKTSELKNEEQILNMVQAKTGQGAVVDFESTTELQKRVPVQPLTDQFLLNLEKAEVVSNSLIINMAFADGESPAETVTPEATETAEDALTTDGEADSSASVTADSEGTPTESADTTTEVQSVAEAPGTLPDSLKKLSATMNVTSPSYEEMVEFLQSVMSMNRIITIDNLSFKGPEEIKFRDQSAKALEYQLTVSAYYYPSLTELQKQLPSIVTPKPSEKTNPLSGNEPEEDADLDGGN